MRELLMKRSFRKAILALLAVVATQLVTLQAVAAQPDKLPKPDKGKGRYIMVLWDPGTPIPGSDGKFIKKMKEPDVEKLGGKVLHSKSSMRLIDLPLTAAKQLRQHEAVATLQRLWMGEPLDELAEEPVQQDHGRGLETESDTNLNWGPRQYTYDDSGNITSIGMASPGITDSYSYDTGGRLIESTVSGKTERFKYDAFGNLVEKGLVGETADLIPVDGSSNRMIGAAYDAAGNVTTRKGREAYSYDSLGMMSVQMLASTGATANRRSMIYDANDERIGSIDGGISRWSIRDFDGQVIREFSQQFSSAWFWERDYVRGEGQLIGGDQVLRRLTAYPGPDVYYGGKRHYHLDHLGSVRVVTDDDHRSVSEHDYFVFGVTPTKAYQEPVAAGTQVDTMRFAGHERDFMGVTFTETTDYLEYMHARFYDPNLGRFLSVDPANDVNIQQAQSWNKYSYVRDNPVNDIDPTGMVACTVTFGGNTFPSDCSTVYGATVPDPGPSSSMSGFLSGFSNTFQMERRKAELYRMRDALNRVIPNGSLQVGVFGTLALPWGGADLSTGIVLNRGDTPSDVGLFGYASGAAVGFDVGAGVMVTWIPGPINNVSGNSTTVSAGRGPYGGSVVSSKSGSYTGYGGNMVLTPSTRFLPLGSAHVSTGTTGVVTFQSLTDWWMRSR